MYVSLVQNHDDESGSYGGIHMPHDGFNVLPKKYGIQGYLGIPLEKNHFVSIAIAVVYQILTYNPLVQNPWLVYIYKCLGLREASVT